VVLSVNVCSEAAQNLVIREERLPFARRARHSILSGRTFPDDDLVEHDVVLLAGQTAIPENTSCQARLNRLIDRHRTASSKI